MSIAQSPLSFSLPRVLLGNARIFQGTDPATIPFTVRGAAVQTADLFVVDNSAGTDMLRVDASGNLTIAGTANISIDEAITGNLTLSGNLVVNGNTTLGNAAGDTVTVTGTPTFSAPVTMTSTLDVTGITTTQSLVSTTRLGLRRRGAAPAPIGAQGQVYTRAGDINTTELFYLDAAGNDVQITDSGALDGSSLFWDDDEYIRMGNTAVAPDVRLGWNTTQTVDGWYFGTADGQNTLIVAENGDRTFDFAVGAQTHPTVVIHSATQNTTEDLRLNFANLRFGAGLAVVAADYSIGRNADATNRLHFNVPTGAAMEWSFNDVGFMTAVDDQTQDFIFNTAYTRTDTSGVADYWRDTFTINPGGASSAQFKGRVLQLVTSAALAQNLTGTNTGMEIVITSNLNGANTSTNIRELATITDVDGGTVTLGTGMFSTADVAAGATMTTYNGFTSSFTVEGTITTARGFRVTNATGGGTVTDQYGVSVQNLTKGTNNYGVYVEGASTFSLFMDAGAIRFDDQVQWGAGVATTAANYSVGRNADGTNLLQLNVPTGASFELSVNDVTEMTLSATAVDFQNNSITTTGGGSLTGTWTNLGSVTTIDINGGTIDGVTIGGAVAGAGTFTTLNATGGGALTGTWTNLGTVTTVDINGGTLDGVTIGGASAAAATVTTLSMNNLITWSAGAAITAGSYQIGRDADGTNQLHFNIPTGTSFEWSVNDVPRILLSLVVETHTQGVATTGSPALLTLTGGAHTTLTNGDFTDVLFDINRTVQFTGAVGATIIDNAYGIRITGVNYQTAGAGALTITNASSFYISGTPGTVAGGGGTTLTNAYSVFVDSGESRFDGNLEFGAGNAITAGDYMIGRDADGTNQLHFNAPTGASFEWSVQDTAELVLNATNLQPGTNDGLALGVSGTAFADVFLASGAVVNFAAGDVTLTHATDALTMAGGNLTITQPVFASGSPTGLTFTGGAHTTLTASVEAIDININLARTVEFATGALTQQRAILIQSPTYNFVAASTLTSAVSFVVSGAPTGGANATITNAFSALFGGSSTIAATSAAISASHIGIANGTGATTLNTAINITGNVSMGNQTATTTNANSIRLEPISYISTTNTRTITNPSTLYIGGAPSNAGNIAFTNGPYSLWIDADISRFDGDVQLQSTITSYGNVTTAGRGVAAIFASGQQLAVGTDGTTVATYTVGGVDELVEIGGFVEITAYTSGNAALQLDYTTARGTVVTGHNLNGYNGSNALVNNLAATGHIRILPEIIAVNAGSTVLLKTYTAAGTMTGDWYAYVKRIQ